MPIHLSITLYNAGRSISALALLCQFTQGLLQLFIKYEFDSKLLLRSSGSDTVECANPFFSILKTFRPCVLLKLSPLLLPLSPLLLHFLLLSSPLLFSSYCSVNSVHSPHKTGSLITSQPSPRFSSEKLSYKRSNQEFNLCSTLPTSPSW